jgi:hypothetical protein
MLRTLQKIAENCGKVTPVGSHGFSFCSTVVHHAHQHTDSRPEAGRAALQGARQGWPAPLGALLWRFRFKILGIERKFSLGSFPDVSLKEARLKRDEVRAQVIDGIDPVEEKRQRRIEAELAARTSFQLVEEYIQKTEMEGRSPATIKKACGE